MARLRVLCLIGSVLAASTLLAVSVLAHVDLSGGWAQRFHEDLPERGAGPDIGDYLGLPINDAARLRADTWDAGKWTRPNAPRSASTSASPPASTTSPPAPC
jgi:hypothetical protein